MKILVPALLIIVLLAACSATPRGLSRDELPVRRPDKAKSASVLFIGNSYSFGVPAQLKCLAASKGIKIHVQQVTHGGWQLAQHMESGEAIDAIANGKWDIVVIQEQSRIPAVPSRCANEMIPHVRTLADVARAHGAVPVLYQTWGRRDGDSHYSAHDDFHAMNRRLREGYAKAAMAAGGLTVVPVGDAWEREIDSGNGSGLFKADGSHPTALGDQLTAEVFFKTFFPQASS